MKVVLDTSVLVSAMLVRGIPFQILEQFRDGLWDLVVSGAILEEYGEVLRRPRFKLMPGKISELLYEIENRSIRVIPSKRYHAVSKDPDDNEFVDVAVEASAKYIVSGDSDLLSLKSFQETLIVSPAEFIERAPY